MFLKINPTVLFGRNLKERPRGPDFFRVRVADQAVDMGQIVYIDEMFIIKFEIGGGSPSVMLFISSVVQVPDLGR